jgi:tetratricopeptide (TPR) repeat protein
MNKRTLAVFLSAALLWGCGHENAVTTNVPQHPDLMEMHPAPLTADTHFAAGQLAETQGNIPAAIAQYQQALKLNPKHANSLYHLSVIYTEARQFDQAIPTWQRYVRATNGSPESFANLGICYELAGQPTDAQSSYEAGLQKDSLNVVCRTNYGLMLARQDKIPDAMRIWQPVLTDAQCHYNLASVYELEGRKLQAKLEYQKALELDPKMGDALARLAALD